MPEYREPTAEQMGEVDREHERSPITWRIEGYSKYRGGKRGYNVFDNVTFSIVSERGDTMDEDEKNWLLRLLLN